MASPLHHARLDAVVSELLASDVRHVADLGCGQGELLERLSRCPQFTRLIGIDIDAVALGQARSRLGIDLLCPDERLQVCLGSFEEADRELSGIDAAVMLETIEHIDPRRLSRVEHSVFGRLRPRLAVVTTPNREYNPLHGLSADQRRHPGHRFEWTRLQFRTWCSGVAERCQYQVRFSDIGPRDPFRGSTTQMACFATRSPA